MEGAGGRESVTEPTRERAVMGEYDVVVAGAGLSGTFAAIAAGRVGARTLVVERFADLGGNIGPGMIVAGGLVREAEITLPGGMAGIPAEFMHRLERLRIGPADRYPEEAMIASFVAGQMMAEAGVEVLVRACAADPIMDGTRVEGIFVETVGGRMAVPARVTVDGTGQAQIARRAGAPMVEYLPPDPALADYIRPPYLQEVHPRHYNDTSVYCLIAGADLERYERFAAEQVQLSPQDLAWGQATGQIERYPAPLIPAARRAWEEGSFRRWMELAPGIAMSTGYAFGRVGDGLISLHVTFTGAIDPADPVLMSALERAGRSQALRAVRFYQQNVPGFERAWLVTCAPFLGMRGGPHIEGDHTLTPQESFAGARFDDVLFRNVHEQDHGGDPRGFDVPLRIALPKGIEGLLVCGRGAAYQRRGHDPTGMRARPSMMVFGQCVGTAAALAALEGTTPRQVDVRAVQRRLLADGIWLGEPERLAELGLA
ncbi:MAG: FAD-dependent oxidoreductase [Armatimonadota bacterium]